MDKLLYVFLVMFYWNAYSALSMVIAGFSGFLFSQCIFLFAWIIALLINKGDKK